MNNPLEIDYTDFLPLSHQAIFNQLQGRLKDIVDSLLLDTNNRAKLEIAMIALEIIGQCSNNEEAFQKKREKFLAALLTEVNLCIKTTADKALLIAQRGFFKDLIANIDTKKKQYHSAKDLITLVDHFHSQILPILIKQEADKKLLATIQKHSRSIPSVIQAYDNLMACRTYFTLPKCIHEFLALLQTDQKWKQETYDCFFNLLNVQHATDFTDFEKTELSKAVFRLHSPLSKKSFEQCSEYDIKEFVKCCFQLKHYGGEEVLEFYFSALSRKQSSHLDEMIRVLNLLLMRLKEEDCCETISQWIRQELNWKQLLENIERDYISPKLDKHGFQEDMAAYSARFKDDGAVTHPLADEDLKLIFRQYRIIEDLCAERSHWGFNQLMNQAHQIRQIANKGSLEELHRLELIAIGRLAIRIEFSIYPYSTQILALLGLFASGKSRQAQVKTGEGKSIIVALWAFVMAMECRAVDIITSARYLAVRDYNKFAQFFQRCGITTSHICYDDQIPRHFKAQILYAPAFDFEFAWMKDLVGGENLFQERLKVPYVSRNFDVVCVDESDNLLIDNSRNGARLAYPADESYDWVYARILSFVRENKNHPKHELDILIARLRDYLSQCTTGQELRTCQQFPDERLRIWIESAYHALFELIENKDYVIKIERNEKNSISRRVQIVDLQTGRISQNSRWSNGIHEFLEVKHDIIVEKESLTPISLSHAVFYQFYKTIYALTGTAERFQTREIYQIDSFDIPPHNRLQRKDLPPMIAETYIESLKLIMESTRACIQAGRPILILCATIYETQRLAEYMNTEKISFQMLNEIQDEPEHAILSHAGAPGKVTIATNTAGRGTDIILSPESLRNGGLHVLLTFYPDSKRVEDQAIGRAGRQGQPGSSQIVINKKDPQIENLIREHKASLEEDALIELLNKQRELREKSQASIHLARANFERFLAQKTHFFFECFQKWVCVVEQDIKLESFAEKLSSIRLSPKKKLNFGHLGNADLMIAEECKRLLTVNSKMLSWKVFLQKVVERMKRKIITDWVHIFFEPAEKQLMATGLAISALRAQLESLFRNYKKYKNQDGYEIYNHISNQFTSDLEQIMQSTQADINHKFDDFRPQREKLMAIDGSGIFVYLKEITTINLLPTILR
ncbi:MAG: hypothetical protein ACSNEK_06040 [Parachlamydiaceae bacterium]